MIMEQSDIIDYYPVNFKTDLNGKQQEWEAVVLIPFIDEVSMSSKVGMRKVTRQVFVWPVALCELLLKQVTATSCKVTSYLTNLPCMTIFLKN